VVAQMRGFFAALRMTRRTGVDKMNRMGTKSRDVAGPEAVELPRFWAASRMTLRACVDEELGCVQNDASVRCVGETGGGNRT